MSDHAGGGDTVQRFLFEEGGVRGELVQLDASWQAVLERHPYPENVRRQLGEALAAVVLLSSTIKYDGTLILQVQGSGPLQALVTQATHLRTVRGLARWRDEVPAGALTDVFGTGRLVLTIANDGAEPYQGVVALEGDVLASALEAYFARSEQLPTRLWLAADGRRAAGLFLQELPSSEARGSDWSHLVTLADTVRTEELLRLPSREILRRLFHEETVRVFDPDTVSFRCGCSRERIERTLVMLGAEEVRGLLEERGIVEVSCEFCNRTMRLDRVDIEQLFTNGFRIEGSGASN